MLAKRLVNYPRPPLRRASQRLGGKSEGILSCTSLKSSMIRQHRSLMLEPMPGTMPTGWRHSKGCIAFEPNPELARLVEHKYAATGVRVFAYALSDHSGHATLRVPVIDGQECSALATIEPANSVGDIQVREIVVPLHRLDDLELETVGVIKIDAEGHELAVLGGAHDLIARDRPNVMIEVEDRHRPGSLAAVRSFFDERGYEGFFLVGRRIAPIAQFDPALHQDPSWVVHDRVAIDKNYVNTFIFTASPHLAARLSGIARSKASL
jgi:FkbM family methyltransferase